MDNNKENHDYLYCCKSCDTPIQKRDTKYCTQCGLKISHPIKSEYLIDGNVERWNITLIGFCIVWVLGAIALTFNSLNGDLAIVMLGIVGLLVGGVFISKIGPMKSRQKILIDKRKIELRH